MGYALNEIAEESKHVLGLLVIISKILINTFNPWVRTVVQENKIKWKIQTWIPNKTSIQILHK